MRYTGIIASLVFLLMPQHLMGQEFNLSDSIKRGKVIYSSNCASCHMSNGTGIKGVYPPLTGVDSLMNDESRIIKSVLEGVEGPTVVNGVAYNGSMQSYSMTDRQVSDLLNYIRNSWGNEGDAILPDEIQPALKDQDSN